MVLLFYGDSGGIRELDRPQLVMFLLLVHGSGWSEPGLSEPETDKTWSVTGLPGMPLCTHIAVFITHGSPKHKTRLEDVRNVT